MRRSPTRRGNGLAPQTLVEHALCPLDATRALQAGSLHQVHYEFTDRHHNRKTATANVACPFGLSPNECQERLLNGQYAVSDGAITADEAQAAKPARISHDTVKQVEGKTWAECYDRYRQHRTSRIRGGSLSHAISRLQIAERIFIGYFEDQGRSEFNIRDCCTLEILEYLQERLLAGDECRYERRSPNTVNSMLGAVMSFVRYCHDHDWINRIPRLDKLEVDDVMKEAVRRQEIPISGGLMGGTDQPTHSSEAELRKLKALLASL